MKLQEIMNNVQFSLNNGDWENIKNNEILDITYNSAKSKPGFIFIALVGETVDGHNYALDAYNKGCRTFILQHDLEQLGDDCIKILVENTRTTLSRISANFFGNPSKELTIIGITGTKGKTTVTNYISTVLNSAGLNTGVIGTNGTFYNGKFEKTVNTTPESYELHRLFRTMLDEGVKAITMEVSSGGLMMHRVDDVDFDIAIFSNLSEDHIGPKEHPTFEHYLSCKAKLFTMCRYGIINCDDPYANEIIKNATCHIDTFSINNASTLQATDICYSNSLSSIGVDFNVLTSKGSTKFHICSPGTFSIYNALAVIGVCRRLGIDSETAVNALKNAKVDGRVQVLPILPYATVIVDYAHNGMSLETILKTLKEYKPNRILCLFGSVGGRTVGRRKELGDVAAKYCDISVLTSDNPDFEEPLNIIKDIEPSFIKTGANYIIEPNREEAIKRILNLAKEGDIILLAGKGHEKYQLIKGERVPFDETKIAADVAKEILTTNKLLQTSL